MGSMVRKALFVSMASGLSTHCLHHNVLHSHGISAYTHIHTGLSQAGSRIREKSIVHGDKAIAQI